MIFRPPYGFFFNATTAAIASRLCDHPLPAESMPTFWPHRGAALLFLAVKPAEDGAEDAARAAMTPLPRMWHGGCRVMQGEKLLLTAFKQLPPPARPPSWWAPRDRGALARWRRLLWDDRTTPLSSR